MLSLAIDCSTQACSVALFDGHDLVAGEHRILGRGHAEHLVPMIAALPDKGRAERILVAIGPGSFTGIRIGIAAAQALGIAWNRQVLGYPTLSLVAARASQHQPGPVTVCMHGGHGEWFVQNFADGGGPQEDVRSLRPEQAARARRHRLVAGDRAQQLVDLLDDEHDEHDEHIAFNLLPDAREAFLLNESELRSVIKPIYGRPPDAKTAA